MPLASRLKIEYYEQGFLSVAAMEAILDPCSSVMLDHHERLRFAHVCNCFELGSADVVIIGRLSQSLCPVECFLGLWKKSSFATI
jgi:hypothetical protein